MSDMTKNDLIRQNVFLTQEVKNLKIENERLRRIGLIGRILKALKINRGDK